MNRVAGACALSRTQARWLGSVERKFESAGDRGSALATKPNGKTKAPF